MSCGAFVLPGPFGSVYAAESRLCDSRRAVKPIPGHPGKLACLTHRNEFRRKGMSIFKPRVGKYRHGRS